MINSCTPASNLNSTLPANGKSNLSGQYNSSDCTADGLTLNGELLLLLNCGDIDRKYSRPAATIKRISLEIRKKHYSNNTNLSLSNIRNCNIITNKPKAVHYRDSYRFRADVACCEE